MLARLFRLLFVLTITTTLLIPVSARGDGGDRAELRRGFEIGLRHEPSIRQKLAQLGFTGEKLEILVTHQLLLFSQQQVVDRIFQEAESAGILNTARNPSAEDLASAQDFGLQLFNTLSMRGFRRLEHEDLKVVLRQTVKFLDDLPLRACSAIASGGVTTSQQEAALISLSLLVMSVGELENYLRVVRSAVFAEVRQYPSIKTVSEPQRKIAEAAYLNALEARITARSDAEEIWLAIAQPTNVSADVQCELEKLSALAVLDMQGVVAEWQARIYLELMQ